MLEREVEAGRDEQQQTIINTYQHLPAVYWRIFMTSSYYIPVTLGLDKVGRTATLDSGLNSTRHKLLHYSQAGRNDVYV